MPRNFRFNLHLDENEVTNSTNIYILVDAFKPKHFSRSLSAAQIFYNCIHQLMRHLIVDNIVYDGIELRINKRSRRYVVIMSRQIYHFIYCRYDVAEKIYVSGKQLIPTSN